MVDRLRFLLRRDVNATRNEFPQLFGGLTFEEEVVYEAVESGLAELGEITRYARNSREKTEQVLNGLVARGKIKSAPGKKTDRARGAVKLLYTIIKKK